MILFPLSLLCFLCFILCTSLNVFAVPVNKFVDRNIDVSTSVVRVTEIVQAVGIRRDHYEIAISDIWARNLSALTVSMNGVFMNLSPPTTYVTVYSFFLSLIML
jgi:hypothetical protein